jgi:hypothetical protein
MTNDSIDSVSNLVCVWGQTTANNLFVPNNPSRIESSQKLFCLSFHILEKSNFEIQIAALENLVTGTFATVEVVTQCFLSIHLITFAAFAL